MAGSSGALGRVPCRVRRPQRSRSYCAGLRPANFPLHPVAKSAAFFSHVGPVFEILESKFDAFTVTYSSSHGYHALAALADAAEKLGLDHKTALTAAAHAIADGILAWRESRFHWTRYCRKLPLPAASPLRLSPAWMNRDTSALVEQGLRAA